MSDLKQYLIDEFVDDYMEARMNRRDVLKRIAGITGSMTAAVAILAACGPAPVAILEAPPTSAPAPTATSAPAPTSAPTLAGPNVSPNDPDIVAEEVQFPAPDGSMLIGYAARPKGNGPFPLVLVCHENRGLLEHIKDVTRRAAKSGYASLAVDLLSREGGTGKVADASQVPGLLSNQPMEQHVTDFQAGLQYLQSQSYAQKDRVGMVGFCFGGNVTWRVALETPEVLAAVPFYGPVPTLDNVSNMNAAVLGIYGEQDRRVNRGIPDAESKMQAAGKVYEKIIYPGANHAFHNDTSSRYNQEAATDAWARTIGWFDKYLRS